jgi:hypothetical protein
MSFLNDLGVETAVPTIDITGIASNTWVYVLVIAIVGVILITGVAFLLFFKTYNKKIVLFENISGQGYQPIRKARARTIKLGVGGGELLKTFSGGMFFPTSGRKMGKNTYWYAKGIDGYYYNFLMGDLDDKRLMLDIEPVDTDVRMFHIALDRLSHQTYGKNSFIEKYGVHMILFAFLIVMIMGMWFIVGKIGDATAPLAASTDNAVKIQEANDKTLVKLDSLIRGMGFTPKVEDGGSGIIPVT